jgi:hypothetical protein
MNIINEKIRNVLKYKNHSDAIVIRKYGLLLKRKSYLKTRNVTFYSLLQSIFNNMVQLLKPEYFISLFFLTPMGVLMIMGFVYSFYFINLNIETNDIKAKCEKNILSLKNELVFTSLLCIGDSDE